MVISGYNYRTICDQNNFSYTLDLSLNNTTGTCMLGFSGSMPFVYNFISGKIYDNNNNFIYGYEPNTRINISGNIDIYTYDCWINKNPIIIGQTKPSGIFSNFIIYPQNTIATLSLNIYGDIPEYTILNSGTCISGGFALGTIINTGWQSFSIFSGVITDSYNNFSLSGLQTGRLTNSGTFKLNYTYLTSGLFTVPITLYTDFGTIIFDYTVSGA